MKKLTTLLFILISTPAIAAPCDDPKFAMLNEDFCDMQPRSQQVQRPNPNEQMADFLNATRQPPQPVCVSERIGAYVYVRCY